MIKGKAHAPSGGWYHYPTKKTYYTFADYTSASKKWEQEVKKARKKWYQEQKKRKEKKDLILEQINALKQLRNEYNREKEQYISRKTVPLSKKVSKYNTMMKKAELALKICKSALQLAEREARAEYTKNHPFEHEQELIKLSAKYYRL